MKALTAPMATSVWSHSGSVHTLTAIFCTKEVEPIVHMEHHITVDRIVLDVAAAHGRNAPAEIALVV